MSHVSFRVRKETGKYVFDIRVGDCRVRPQTNLRPTKANLRVIESLAKKMNAEIELGTFSIEQGIVKVTKARRKNPYPA